MRPPPIKEFTIRHTFTGIQKMENEKYAASRTEKHFKVPWRILIKRKSSNLSFYLGCSKPLTDPKWAIEAEFDLKLISKNGHLLSRKTRFCFGNMTEITGTASGYANFLPWMYLESDYVVDGMVNFEIFVKIQRMYGFEKEKTIMFDESMKPFSDLVLVVGDEDFYVSRLFLCYHSVYFQTMLSGKFEDSKKAKIELGGINAVDFQNFLEVLYGESDIYDSTVDGILILADMYDAPIAVKRCEDYLLKRSGKMLKEKLELATEYGLKELENKCLSRIQTTDDVRSVLAHNEKFSSNLLKVLVEKCKALGI